MSQDRRPTAPRRGLKEFACPHCQVFSSQTWWRVLHDTYGGKQEVAHRLGVSECQKCRAQSIWLDKRIVDPDHSEAPHPNSAMPDDPKVDFEEARAVLSRSPRSSIALLRLVIQKICVVEGLPGKNLNADIAELVAQKRILPFVQKAFDAVRLYGNASVHPSTDGIQPDDPKVALVLFKIVKHIVAHLYQQPGEIEDFYDTLPADKRDAIRNRDS